MCDFTFIYWVVFFALVLTACGLAEVREIFLQTFYKARNKVKRKIVLRRIATRIFAKPMLATGFSVVAVYREQQGKRE